MVHVLQKIIKVDEMTFIQILGTGDTKMLSLKKNLMQAIAECPVEYRLEEVSEYNQIYASGVTETPAMIFDGEIVSEGRVPSVEDIKKLLNNRHLLKSKLVRLRRILVAVDLSPASENALFMACKMAQLFDASLEVVYVMDSIFEGNSPSLSGFLSGYKKTMQEELDAFVKNATAKGGNVCPGAIVSDFPHHEPTKAGGLRTRIAFGFPEDVISEMSKRADLLVIGTTGSGAITRKLFGSVSITVSKNAECPVLLVPSGAQYKGFHRILYASNFESLDSLTIKQTVSFARKFNAQLHFVHVGKPAEAGIDLEKKLFEINYVYSDPEKPFIFSKVVGDEVVEKLHDYAFENRCDLFVFVTHQRTFWESLLHHSLSKDMLLHTNTPVLVIHSDKDMG